MRQRGVDTEASTCGGSGVAPSWTATLAERTDLPRSGSTGFAA
jgi:hypothetical protein